MTVLKKRAPQNISWFEEIVAPKKQLLRQSSYSNEGCFSKNKAVLKQSSHKGEGKSPFDKKFQITLVITLTVIIFTERFSNPDKYS